MQNFSSVATMFLEVTRLTEQTKSEQSYEEV